MSEALDSFGTKTTRTQIVDPIVFSSQTRIRQSGPTRLDLVGCRLVPRISPSRGRSTSVGCPGNPRVGLFTYRRLATLLSWHSCSQVLKATQTKL